MRANRGWSVLSVAGLMAGCGGEAPADGEVFASPASAFCAQIQTDVNAFLSGFDAPAGERYGGTAVTASRGEFAQGMNAFIAADYHTRQHQNFVNLMTLLQYDADLNPVPYLAESYQVSDDGTSLTFHIRDDVYWHDGVRTTAYDVAFTYARVTDPELAFPNPNYWTYYDSEPGAMEVVDSFTVRVGLEPHADFMDPWTALAVMPRHLLEDVAAEDMAQHPYNSQCPVGNGPFVFVEHRPDESWTFGRNPAFPEGLGGPPYLDRIVYRVITDASTLLNELLTEGIDVYSQPSPDQAPAIVESDAVNLVAAPFRQVTLVAWNSRRPQLADRRVRMAMAMATNRQGIVDALVGGYGDIAEASVPITHWGIDRSIDGAPAYDPAGARRLLEEAGWTDDDGDGVREKDGVRLEFTIKSNDGNQLRNDVAELLQAQLGDVGVEVRPEILAWPTLLQQVMEEKDFDAVVFGWVTDFRLDDTDLFHSERIAGPSALSGTQNPDIDRMLDTLQTIVDRDQAVPVWHEYQRLIVEEQPYLFLFNAQQLDGVNRRLQDVEMDSRGEWLNAREWWIPADQRKYGSVADQ